MIEEVFERVYVRVFLVLCRDIKRRWERERVGEVTCLEVWGSLHGYMLNIMEVAPPKSTLITFFFV